MAIRMDPVKTAAISDQLVPKVEKVCVTCDLLRAWLHTYKKRNKFVQGFGKLISPIVDLSMGKVPWG